MTRRDQNRPWSTDETLEEMRAVSDALDELAPQILPTARDAARAKWAYRKAQARAIDAGATQGCKNDMERKAKIWTYQVEPGVTVGDLGEEADRLANELLAQNTALRAITEQGRLITSAHVSGREAAK